MDFQEICSCGDVKKFANRFPFLFKSNSNSKHFKYGVPKRWTQTTRRRGNTQKKTHHFKYSQQKQLHIP